MRNILAIVIFIPLLSGCASIGKQWKEFINGKSATKSQAATKPVGATYSDTNNLMPAQYRQYKRTKRKDIEDNAHLESKSGSLWVMEGQGAYLFSQNVVRMIGDPLGVRIEGEPQEQLTSKSKVIGKLIAQIEERRRRAAGRGPATDEKKEETPTGTAPQNKAAKGAPAPAAQNAMTAAPGAAATDETKDFSVKTVPTRVVERLVDGNYRVRGTQPFMIGTREYKVIVSGIVRAEDFNEEGISAAQLLDANFDIVSSKSTETR
jgi:flagellar L-ring protein precursor FlgH